MIGPFCSYHSIHGLLNTRPYMSHFEGQNQRYNNADLNICQYICLHLKITCWKFHIKTPFTFWDMRTWDRWNVCLQTLRNKLAYFLRNLQTSRANNSRILGIKNAKFWGYCYYINTNMQGVMSMNFSLILAIEFPKKKSYGSSENWKFKLWQTFSTNSLFF